MPSLVDRLASSESGAVAPLTALSLIALVSVAGLAYDVSRGFALRAELDNAADAAALAGATQLDGRLGSLDRARTAARSVLARNPQLLADVPETAVTIANNDIKFLDANRVPVTNGRQAQFIQIDLTPRSLGVVFGTLAKISKFQVTAHAVAGYGASICRAPPILICNPDEANGNLTFVGDNHIGEGIVLQEGGSGTWTAGDFGVIDVKPLDNVTGVPAIQYALARTNPQVECYGNTVKTVQATVPDVEQFINVRFDIYGPAAYGLRGENAYQPALNTITGRSQPNPTMCTPTQDPNGQDMPLPRDNMFSANPTAKGIGDGNWALQAYFMAHHTSVPPDLSAYGPNGVGNAQFTRYQVYQWELSYLAKPDDSIWANGEGGPPITSTPRDWARPMCYTGSSTQPNPDRRTFSAVVANCQNDGIGPGSTANVIAGVDIFLTEPVTTNGGSRTLYGEILGTSTNASPAGRADRVYTVRLVE